MHWWSRMGLPFIGSNTTRKPIQWRLPFFLTDYPKNLFLLPLLLTLNHLVSVFEVAVALEINSLGLFSHSSHTIFNGITLTGVVTSIFINWRVNARYSLTYVPPIVKTNFLVGFGLLLNSIAIAYLSSRDILEPAIIERGSLLYLVPVPALLLNLLVSYAVLHGNDDPAFRGRWGKGASLEGECERRRKMSARSIYWHMLANAIGSVAAIGATVLVQCFDWIAADGLCAAFVALMMFVCALHTLKESVCMIIAVRAEPNIFVVSYRVNEVDQFADNFGN